MPTVPHSSLPEAILMETTSIPGNSAFRSNWLIGEAIKAMNVVNSLVASQILQLIQMTSIQNQMRDPREPNTIDFRTMNSMPDTTQLGRISNTSNQQPINKGGLTVQPGGLNIQQTMGLPAALHKNFQDLQGTIPLTTMDLRWKEEAANWQAEQ
ncbi:hypothetical protein CROQUDRAFT_92979 [Cronartium quercuum f. sp. fusiforme G11]|uniref:Uncharacterized protein n=1 Tax=Cronartium quercuum f. sp. fusiforme G11 TaxID=708437 RepID=A0A9P6TD26_9BASI|nr:hypothetical protein CROQUDRAFT_92979 [Cronartium quercuum f. sp. fusiforme G11]